MTEPNFDDQITPVASPSPSAIRVPSRDGAEHERLLAEADDRARAGAAQVLDTWFPALAVGSLAQVTDATTFRVGQATSALIDTVDATALLDRLLSMRSLQPPQIRLARDGEQVGPDELLEHASPQPVGKVGVRPGLVARAMHSGYTIVLDGVDSRDVWSIRLSEIFERVFTTTVNINGYLSYRPFTSFGAHWDTQEVVILQLLGRKDWAVHQPVALSMTRESYPKDVAGPEVWSGRLAPGDALYIPRGWAHRVSSIDELSYHYTITIPRQTGIKALEHVVAGLGATRDEVVAAPMSAGETAWEPPFTVEETPAINRLVASAVAQRRLAVTARPTQRFSMVRAALAGKVDPLLVRFPYPGGWLISEDDSPDRVVLSAGQKHFSVARSLLPSIASWSDGLVHVAVDARQRALAQRLISFDLMEVVDDPIPWPHRLAGDEPELG